MSGGLDPRQRQIVADVVGPETLRQDLPALEGAYDQYRRAVQMLRAASAGAGHGNAVGTGEPRS